MQQTQEPHEILQRMLKQMLEQQQQMQKLQQSQTQQLHHMQQQLQQLVQVHVAEIQPLHQQAYKVSKGNSDKPQEHNQTDDKSMSEEQQSHILHYSATKPALAQSAQQVPQPMQAKHEDGNYGNDMFHTNIPL